MGIKNPKNSSFIIFLICVTFIILVPILASRSGHNKNAKEESLKEKPDSLGALPHVKEELSADLSALDNINKDYTSIEEQVPQSIDLFDLPTNNLSDISNNINKTNGFLSGNTYGTEYKKDSKGLYELNGPVMDVASIFNEEQYKNLEAFLLDLNTRTGIQIVVLTVPSLNNSAIEEFSIRHAEKWQLGQKGKDNGAILTVAMAEHQVRIETGYGTEGTLTDAKCSKIIRTIIVPNFKSGKYAEGIQEAVQNMAAIITEDSSLITEPMKQSVSADNSGALIFFTLFFVWVIIIISMYVSHGGSSRPVVTTRSSSFGSFNSHSSNHHSGGSSFHGGGGSFGGGGASGHW